MDRVARRIRRGVDATYVADVRRDYQRLVDDAYLAEKGVIMDAIDDFIDLVEPAHAGATSSRCARTTATCSWRRSRSSG